MTAYVLAIDTSERMASLAIATREPSGTIHAAVTDAAASHGRDLLPTLATLLREARLGTDDLGAIVVGRGPGSYTGLRVGIATAIGLARPRRLPCFGIPSVEGLASAFLLEVEEVGVVLDARRSGFHVARYARDPQDSPKPRVVLAPCFVPGERLAAVLATPDLACYVDRPDAARPFLQLASRPRLERGDHRIATFLLDAFRHASAEDRAAWSDLAPLYLRRSSAEERHSDLHG